MRERAGKFIVSIDYEFELGLADRRVSGVEKALIRDEVAITRRLLKLFEAYRVPATWAIVGHLLERSCTWNGDVVHPEYDRPVHHKESRDWFFHHPPRGQYSDVCWFDTEGLIRDIANARVGHEVASHSYAHVLFDRVRGGRETVHVDLDNVMRVHAAVHHPPVSFVFPRNRERYHDALKAHGFTCYRGITRRWYYMFPALLQKPFHYGEYFLPFDRTTEVSEGKEGLVNVPASFLLFSRAGLRRLVPVWLMKWHIRRGLRQAADRGRLLHLWFHPSNFWHDRETQFSIFEYALREADRLRREGALNIVTMRQCADEYQQHYA